MHRTVGRSPLRSGALWRTRLVAALLALGTSGVPAADPGVTADGARPARDVRSWLMRIHEAATQRNFQGTFVVSGGGAVSSARIAHYCDGPEQVERIDALDGERRTVLRHNERVHTLWPEARVVQVEQRTAISAFPGLLQQAMGDQLADFYKLTTQPNERIAGHESNVLLVEPRDALRYGYRLWAEKNTGLLLRADVLDGNGGVVETSAFSEVSLGVRSQADAVLAQMKKLDGWKVVKPAMTPTRLEDEGWSLQPGVPGFRMLSCVKRPLGEPGGAQVLQSIWSDGLTHVSVFIEPYDAKRHAREMSTRVGATQTLMRQRGDAWITVVGDVPAATLKKFTAGLERRK
jgi:sigma-E factor negative regulatory protein RseB